MTNVTVLNDDDPEVRLMYARRKALATVLYGFADALRTFVPLRKAYFDDVLREIAHYRESLCPCGKPSVPRLTSPLCEERSIVPTLWLAGRLWWFPGRQITAESQFEWKNGRAYLLERDGSATEGILLVGEVALE